MALRFAQPVSRIRAYTGDATAIRRERKGMATYFSVGDLPIARVSGTRIFDTQELFDIYRLCPDIRAPIDFLSMQFAQAPWLVAPKTTLRKGTARWLKARALADQCTAWLQKPNQDETWHIFAQKWAQDALIYDASAVEHAMSKKGALEELVAWRGGDITPLLDEHGRHYRYRQDLALGEPVYWIPEEISYTNLFANTTYPDGQPLIETLVEEFLTMRASSVHLRRSVDADEVPPGILFLSGVAETAYQRLEQRLKMQGGRDDVLRMVNSFDKEGRASWIEMKRSPKDLEWVPNIAEVRYRIWRLFQVKPVQMGETSDVPRASAEVQLQVAGTGLTSAMMVRMTEIVNQRWLPMIAALFGNAEAADLIAFSYDTTPAMSQEDRKRHVESLTLLFDRSLLSADEVRAELGYDPLTMDKDPDLNGDGEVDAEEANADQQDGAAEDAQPVKDATGRPRPVGRRGHGLRPLDLPAFKFGAQPSTRRPPSALPWRLASLRALPSGWQPASRFEGARVVPVNDLAALVDDYDATIKPLYDRAQRDVLKAATAAVSDGVLTSVEASGIAGAIGRALETLTSDWSAQTVDLYDGAAQLGQDTAAGWGGASVAWRNTSTRYHGDAIRYLNTTGASPGLVATLRRDLLDLLVEAVSRASTRPARPKGGGEPQRRADEPLPAGLASFLTAIRAVFERNRNRIANWAGKLVELAHGVIVESLTIADQQAAVSGSDGDPWWVEWVEVADGATCSTCREEGGKPWRPLSDLPTMPGGATQCGARCRCLLNFARRSEVESGKAVKLGPVT